MAALKIGDPFGLSAGDSQSIDWELALARIVHDQRSDFIYAPHLSFVYKYAGSELIATVKQQLKSTSYNPGVPVTIEVPKSFRVKVKGPAHRLGPNYSRPGSILLPHDRLLYQCLADQAAPIVDAKTDSERSFSHLLAPSDSATMFLPTRACWNRLRKSLTETAKHEDVSYILKIDVANFFGSLNQHTLINSLNDAGYKKSFSDRLENILIRYTPDRNSRGILQGIYPSDLLGNFYLTPIDRFLKEREVPSARYVDDIFVFLKSVDAADQLVRGLIPELRSYDLVLNEAKSVITPKSSFHAEEPDLDALFADAFNEIAAQVDEEDFGADYGFQSEWEEEEEEEDEVTKEALVLKATQVLFDAISNYDRQEENIERFCLPIFTRARSDYAVTHVVDSFKKRPSMSQLYVAYLSKFQDDDQQVHAFLTGLLIDSSLFDWQRMWVLAVLLQAQDTSDAVVKQAWSLLSDANRHPSLRAVAATYVGRFGDIGRRKALTSMYASVSPYVQAAIYSSSRHWPNVERKNAKAQWEGHGPLHALTTIAIKNFMAAPAAAAKLPF